MYSVVLLVLSIHWINSPAYYLQHTSPEYYFKGGEPEGIWWGEGARRLRLRDKVTPAQLTRLFQGFSPDGAALIQNAGQKRHQAAWDLTFSAPKPFSVLWSAANPATRQALQRLHEAAIKDGLQYLRENAFFTRRGKGGLVFEPAWPIVARFAHASSRELDPQLHTHCLLLNLCVRDDGTTGTIFSKSLYLHKLTAGAIYQASLEARLREELGVETQAAKVAFTIPAVPEELCGEHSKRRQAIEAELREAGVQTAKAAALATLATRKAKQTPPRDELLQRWQTVNSRFGFTERAARSLFGRATPTEPGKVLPHAVQRAAETLLETRNAFSAQQLLRQTVVHCLGHGVRPERIQQAVQAHLTTNLVPLSGARWERHYTTQAVLAEEKKVLDLLAAGQDEKRFVIPAARVRKVLDKQLPLDVALSPSDRQRNEEQRQAVEHLTRRPGNVQVVSGVAGTGKSYLLRVCHEAWSKSGFQVLGLAVSGVAARNLQQKTGIASDTLAMALTQLNATTGAKLKHHAQQLARAACGKPTYARSSFELTSRTIVVVDEFGMVPTSQARQLLEHVARAGAKLVAVGDRRQLQPIGRGGVMDAIEKRVEATRLEQITRQRLQVADPQPDWARQAVRHFERGEPGAGLNLFAARGLVSVAATRDEAIRQMVDEWAATSAKQPLDHLLLASTKDDVARLNQLCQQRRFDAGLLRGESFVFRPRAPRNDAKLTAIEIHPGDCLICTKKNRLLDVENGDRGIVKWANVHTKTIGLEFADGRTARLPLKSYPYVQLGFALSTHKAQGTTVERASVLLGGPMQDLHLTYVQASRAVEATRFYVDQASAGRDGRALLGQMAQTKAATLAHDLVPRDLAAPRESPRRGVTRGAEPALGGASLPPEPSDSAAASADQALRRGSIKDREHGAALTRLLQPGGEPRRDATASTPPLATRPALGLPPQPAHAPSPGNLSRSG